MSRWMNVFIPLCLHSSACKMMFPILYFYKVPVIKSQCKLCTKKIFADKFKQPHGIQKLCWDLLQTVSWHLIYVIPSRYKQDKWDMMSCITPADRVAENKQAFRHRSPSSCLRKKSLIWVKRGLCALNRGFCLSPEEGLVCPRTPCLCSSLA